MHREATTTAEYTLLDQQLMQRATRYFAWQAELAKQQLGRRVIEVGCGTGNFTRHLVDRDLVVGLDIVDGCVEQSRARFDAHSHMQFRCLDVQDSEFLALKSLQPDSVVCLNVLEHVDDYLAALRNLRAALEPGGRAIVLVPHDQAIYGSLDKALGHYRRYAAGELEGRMQQAGFQVERTLAFNRITRPGWRLNGQLLRRQTFSRFQLGLFDVLTPVWRRIDRLLPWPAVSIIAIGVAR